MLQFKSRDAKRLAVAAQRCGPGSKLLVLTDGMFARDGSAAPLAEYLKVLPKDALILVDDAHGAGVLGRTGQGTLEHAGVSRRRIIQTVTLSKAFGAYGGAILGTARLRQRILDRSQMFVGSTPLPLPLANAALAGVRILKANPSLRRRLLRKCGLCENQPCAKPACCWPKRPGRLCSCPRRARVKPSVCSAPSSPQESILRSSNIPAAPRRLLPLCHFQRTHPPATRRPAEGPAPLCQSRS